MVERARDYSPARSVGSAADSDAGGSYEGFESTPEDFRQAWEAFPGRRVGPNPVDTVGSGESRYGVNPLSLTVANSGPAADYQIAHRLDRDPLYRFKTHTRERGLGIVFRDGFENKSDKLPSSIQYYQNNHTDTVYVSSSRDRDPAGPKPLWVDEGEYARYSMPNVPGGIDVLATLREVAFRHQQEIIHYKGISTLYIGGADVFSMPAERDGHDRLIGSADNLLAAPEVREARRRLEWALTPENVRAATQNVREGRASEYEQFRHQYAEWYARSGQHTEHAGVDGNLWSYAEWWSRHKNAGSEQFRVFSQDWNNSPHPSWNDASPPQPPSATQDLYDEARRARDSVRQDPGRWQNYTKMYQRYQELHQGADARQSRQSHTASAPRPPVGMSPYQCAPPRQEGQVERGNLPPAHRGNFQPSGRGRGAGGPAR
ncbi:hypothetical protein ACFC09_26250 [Streptomyces sp. NPDC056161]|uniref:scabin-related ADP-ribosyltransferase n=1 Tax=Streptomyces sp. NPDC056161 TaxID=3345732 RepID=UPI0035DB5550